MEKKVKSYKEFINESKRRIEMKNIPQYVSDVLAEAGFVVTRPNKVDANYIKYNDYGSSTKRLYNSIKDDKRNFRLIETGNIVFYEYENSDKEYWLIGIYPNNLSEGITIRCNTTFLTLDNVWTIL